MLGNSMLISLVFQAINKTSGAFSQINGEFKKLDAAVKAVSKRFEHLNNIGNKMMMAGAGMTIAGGGLAYSLGLTDAVGQAAQAQHSLRVLGNTGELTKKQIADIGKAIQKTSVDTNQFVADLIPGLKKLVAKGLDPRIATNFLPVIGKTATAEEAAVEDLADTAYAVYDNLKVKVSDLNQVMNTLAKSGNMGSFEIKDMAKHFPVLTANVQALGMKGVGAVAQLGAALQIAMKGAGDPDVAANNFQNFLMKITAKETVANFKKFGVNVKAELESALAAGADPIEHFIKVIQNVTGGDEFKLAELFADTQVKNFIVPMMDNLERYRRIRDDTFKATGVIDEHFKNMMAESPIEQFKNLKINMAALVMPTVNRFFGLLNGVLTRLNGNSTGLKIVLGGVAALLGGGLLLSGLGFMFMGISNGIVAVQVLGTVLRSTAQYALILGYRLITSATSGKIFAAAQWAATGAVKAMAVAQRLLNLAFVSSPIGWIILGIMALGAAGYLLYRNWDKVKDSLQRIVKFISGISLFNIGKNIIESLWKGMMAMAYKPIDASVEIGSKIVSCVKGVLGIKSPSTVFIDVGRMISKGTAIGIGSGLGGLNKSANNMVAAVSVPLRGIQEVTPFTQPILRPRTSGASSNGSNVTSLTYNPTVNIYGTSPSAKEDFEKMLDKHKDKIKQILEAINAREARLAY